MRLRQGHRGGLHVRESSADPRPGLPSTTLLYIHGLGESGLGFETLLSSPRLAAYRQLALDLPGYGKSPWLSEPAGLEQHASTIADWLEREHPEPVTLIGHSMGGVIGQLLCEGWPARVRAFCNVEGNVSLPDCTFSSRANALSEREFERGGYRDLLEELYDAGQRDRALRGYLVSASLADARTYHRNSVELVALSERETLAARLAGLGLPRTYLYGAPRGTGAHSRALLEAVGIAPVAIEESGHWPFVDQPQPFITALLEFLTSPS